MNGSVFYRVSADLVLGIHAAFVVFVVAGLLLILLGGVLRWSWVRNPWFRIGHLVAIAVVVAQAWLGVLCPLTALEMELRSRAGGAVYSGSFMAHWIEMLLFHQAPWWVFTVSYTVFGLLVVGGWFVVRPRRPGGRARALR